MTRPGVPLLLSIAIHLALLALFTTSPASNDLIIPQKYMRVTFANSELSGETANQATDRGIQKPVLKQNDQKTATLERLPGKVADDKPSPALTTPVAQKSDEMRIHQNTTPVKKQPQAIKDKKITQTERKQKIKRAERVAQAENASDQSKKTRDRKDSNNPPQAVTSGLERLNPMPAAAAPNSAGGSSSAADGSIKSPIATVIDVQALRVTKKSVASYPLASRKRREQGTVVLLVEIFSDSVKSVEIEHSSGHPPLDESAISAVKQWKFDVSGYEDGVIARIPFIFELK
jgi:protein TonB